MMKNKNTYQYPWRNNNEFEVLVDGDEYFSSMLKEIKSANSSILLEAYLFESGNTATSFIKELGLAQARGVYVFILLDEYGSKKLSSEDIEKIKFYGIKLVLYNPTSFLHIKRSLKRNHRKLLIIDNRIAFVGGAGITDEFNPDETKNYWHDVMLKINGVLVLDLAHSFNEVLQKQNNPQIKESTSQPSHIKNKARALISSGSEQNEIIRAIITRIRASKKQVWLTSPYFITSWKIRRALRYAAKKGVDVRLIFPGPYSDHKWVSYAMQRYYQRLLRSNISVYEFQPRFSHTKLILCDDWFTIGSSNLDRWNQFLNLDINVEVYDPQSHKQIINLFEADFLDSNLIILKQWNARSIIQHSKEWFAGLIISVLGYIIKKFKR